MNMDNPEESRKKATAYLTQIYGEATNRKFKLMSSKVIIGRGFHADIRLKCPNISRNHCILYHNKKRGWYITDNKSQNGTYVSGRQLKPGESRLLQCGDIIFLGPPAEMPEAFCYDDAFVDDDDIVDTGHEIIEVAAVIEEKIASKKKCLLESSFDSESDIVSPPVVKESHLMDISDSSEHKISNEDMSLHENHNLFTTFSEKCSKSLSQLNKVDTVNQSSCSSFVNVLSSKRRNEINTVSQISPSLSIDELSSKKLRLDTSDSGYQINEISSTGDDQNSLSLLDVEKNDIVESSYSNSDEARKIPENAENSQSVVELELLKSKLALLTDQMKKIEESKMDLLKNYEVVCEKNFALDKQLSEKKKIEEELRNCEMNVQHKIKNELLEKFEEDLICNICTELLIKPTVLDCSHTFCLHCIKEWKKKKNECPICRRKIMTMTPVLTLEHFIDKTLTTLTPEQKERRNQLIKERENQPKKPATPTTSKRRRHGRRRFRQPIPSTNHPLITILNRPSISTHPSVPSIRQSVITNNRRNDVEIVDERRNPFIRFPLLFEEPLQRILSNLTVPEVLLDSQ